MANEISNFDIEKIYTDISEIIVSTKKSVMYSVNTSVIKMYWGK